MAAQVLLLAALAASAAAAAPGAAIQLRTNYMTNPPVIDDPNPRFSWVLSHIDRAQSQTAYRVVVTTTRAGTAVWDSGKVASNATIGVKLPASAMLASDTYYSWTVTWWDAAGAQSPTSLPATFATGLLTQAEWGSSQWIGCHQPLPGDAGDNQLRTEFNLSLPAGVSIVQARAYVTGLGYYRAFINGQRLGMLLHQDPAWTIPSTRVLYSAFEVAPLLNPRGPNVIAAYLGNGWEDVVPNGFNGTGNGVLMSIVVDELVARGVLTAAQGEEAARRLDLSELSPNDHFDTSNWGAVSAALTAMRTQGGVHSLLASAIRRGAVTHAGILALRQDSGLGWDGDGGIANAIRKFRMQLHVTGSDGSTYVVFSSAKGMGAAAAVAAGAAGARSLTSGVLSAPTPVASSWTCGHGALLNDTVYDGVVWDARLETTGWDRPGYAPVQPWPAAVNVADPGGRDGATLLTAQAMPLMEVVSELPPRTISSPAPGVYIFDFEQNFQGVCRLRLPAPLAGGINITLRHAEVLMHPPYGPKDGNIYVGNLRGAKATDIYTTRDVSEGELILEPMFTTHGFRYVEVTGLPFTPDLSLLTGLYVRSAVQQTGAVQFPSASAEPMNQFARAATWGLGSNLLGVVSDCNQRDERKGWAGDSSLTAEAATLAYDMCAFFENWAQVLRDSQVNARDRHPTGSLADTNPRTFGSYPADPAWGTVYPAVVLALKDACGDVAAVQKHYDGVAAWAAWMQTQVVSTGLAKLYSHYGEWVPPPVTPGGGQGPKPPQAMVSSYAYLADVKRMISFASLVGNSTGVAFYTALFNTLSAEYNTAWFNAATGIYGNANGDGLQSAHAATLALGVVPANRTADVVNALVKDITVTHGGHWFAGITGTKFFHRELTNGGRGDLAISTLVDTTYPSWGYTFNHPDEPATTLWELPDAPDEGPGMNSRNHHMYASPLAFLFEVAGLRQAPTSIGWAEAWVWPSVTTSPDVPFASGSYNSIRGYWETSWARVGAAGFALNVTVPAGSVATVVLPLPTGVAAASVSVAESGQAGLPPQPVMTKGAFVPGVAGVSGGSVRDMGASTGQAAVFSVGSGSFVFALTSSSAAVAAVVAQAA